ncbi:MOSC domain-containing protein [Thermodesulfovibrionales bacterium]|nr:MOSC domain-containing protein [Thermodesulfovibrionales bacterium]
MCKRVVSINISKRKRIPKTPVASGLFGVNEGLIGDAHSGPGARQVSLMAKESIDRFNTDITLKKLCAKKGMFGENLTTEGIKLHKLKIGTKLKINDVILEISQIGKECHTRCAIYHQIGECIMPREGVFARVIQSGVIRTGDLISLVLFQSLL